MNFSPNSSFIYGIAVFVILFVLVQSVFFLVRAYKRAKEKGMDMSQIRKTIISTAIFTLAPAFSILLGVITLSKCLGIPLPWIRMSVIGALTYELPAASSAAGAFGASLSNLITDPKVFSAIAWVMTLGILPSIILVPLLMKKIQGGMVSMKNKDSKWSDLFSTSLFLGMISAFLGMVFADIRTGLEGWIPVMVLVVSAALMGVCGLLIKKCKMAWLENYAIPFSMLGAMAFAVIFVPMITG